MLHIGRPQCYGFGSMITTFEHTLQQSTNFTFLTRKNEAHGKKSMMGAIQRMLRTCPQESGECMIGAPSTARAPLSKRTTFVSPYVVSPTFEHYIEELDEWEASWLQHIELFTDPFSVELALSKGLRGVSDGSVWVKRLGAFGWAISDAHGIRLVEVMGPAPGAANAGDAMFLATITRIHRT